MNKLPEDRDARLAFLAAWAEEQRSLLAAEKRRLAEEEHRRLWAEGIACAVIEARQRIGHVPREWSVIPLVVTKPSDLPADRESVFANLMAGLREHEWADPIVSECDEPRYIVPTAIDLARRHHPDARWLLYMEDDVILGPDFGLLPGLLCEAEQLYPHAGIVSFFTMWPDEPGWTIFPMAGFAWLQCAAIRNTDHLAGLRTFIDGLVIRSAGERLTTPRTQHESPAWYRTRPLPPSDDALGAFMAIEYAVHALWCPSLVQHAALASVFVPDRGTRISPTYKQAYG